MDFIEKYMVCGGVCVVGDMCVSVCITLCYVLFQFGVSQA